MYELEECFASSNYQRQPNVRGAIYHLGVKQMRSEVWHTLQTLSHFFPFAPGELFGVRKRRGSPIEGSLLPWGSTKETVPVRMPQGTLT